MEKGFTLTEVIILFVIFLTVAILIVPLSVDDAIIKNNTSKWKRVQSSLSSIPISMINSDSYKNNQDTSYEDFIASIKKVFPFKNSIKYKIRFMNGETPSEQYTFEEIYSTDNGATIAFKWYPNSSEKGEDKVDGMIMYDVNGKRGPNVWGKDIFGVDLYDNKIEPFGKHQDPVTIESDCSRQGTGVYCSYYYVVGVGHDD